MDFKLIFVMRKVLIFLVAVFGFGFVYSQVPLPKGAKLQAIIYPNTREIAVGYVYKKQFVENQEITFFEMNPKFTLAFPKDYSISKKDEVFYICGRFNGIYNEQLLSSLDTIASGVYFTKNETAYIKGVERSYLSKYYNERFTIYKQGIFQISNSEDGNTLTTDPKKVRRVKTTITEIDSYQGYYNNDKNNPVTLQKQSENYMLKIIFDDRVLETVVSPDIIKRYGFFAFDDFIKSSQNVKLNYNNGNIFIGIVEKNVDTYKAKQGEYKFTTGEKYTGTFGLGNLIYYDKGRIFVPDQGETMFADGTTASGDWLKQYNFTDNEWKQIYESSKSLTEIRNMAVRVNQEKQEKIQAEKIAKEQAEKERQEQINQALPIKEPKTDKDKLINELAIFRSSVVELDESIDIALNELAEMDRKMRSRGAVGVGPGNNNPNLVKAKLWVFICEKMICINQGLHTLNPETDTFKNTVKEGNTSARYCQDFMSIMSSQEKCMKNSPPSTDRCIIDCYDAFRSLFKKMGTDDKYWSKESNIKCSVLGKCEKSSK